MPQNLPPLPFESQVDTAELNAQTGRQERTGYISEDWFGWLRTLIGRVDSTPQRQNKATRLQNQGAAIPLTSLALGTLAPGLYRVNVRARITQAATVNSSLNVTIGWADGGAACTKSFSAAMVGNTTGTTGEPFSLLIRIDQNTPITYQTAYASVGGTPMQYELEIVVESVPV